MREIATTSMNHWEKKGVPAQALQATSRNSLTFPSHKERRYAKVTN